MKISFQSVIIGLILVIGLAIGLSRFLQPSRPPEKSVNAASSSGADKTPLKYQNAAQHFSIEFPVGCKEVIEKTSVEKTEFGEVASNMYRSLWGKMGMLEVNAMTLPPKLQEALKIKQNEPKILEMFARTYNTPPSKIVRQEDVVWKSHAARKLLISTPDDDGRAGFAQILIIAADHRIYQLWLMSRNQEEAVFNSFVGSFTLEQSAVTH